MAAYRSGSPLYPATKTGGDFPQGGRGRGVCGPERATPQPGRTTTAHIEYAAIEELRRLAFANILDFAIVRPDGPLEVDLARLERDRASAIREVTLVERTDPSGATTRITRLKLADKSLALARFLRVCGIEIAAHEKGWAEGVQELLSRPEREVVKRVRDRKARGWG